MGLIVLVLFILIQFYPRPQKNQAQALQPNFIGNHFPISDTVHSLLKSSCFDCHSNTTIYPWYASVQPFALFLDNHIQDGKKRLNFSIFNSYPLSKQFHKLEEIEEMLVDNEMPLTSYILLHKEADLNAAQKQFIINWSKQLRNEMKATYPTDSLIRKKR